MPANSARERLSQSGGGTPMSACRHHARAFARGDLVAFGSLAFTDTGLAADTGVDGILTVLRQWHHAILMAREFGIGVAGSARFILAQIIILSIGHGYLPTGFREVTAQGVICCGISSLQYRGLRFHLR